MKTCSNCGETKDLGSFYKRENYNKSGSIYYQSHCKECMNKKQKRRGKKYSERVKEESKGNRLREYNIKPWVCINCGKIIPFNGGSRVVKYCNNNCKSSFFRYKYPERQKIIYIKRSIKVKRQRSEAKKDNKLIVKNCQYCGSEFKTTSKIRLYCNDRCRINSSKKNRYHNNIEYKLLVTLRGHINMRLRKGTGKSATTKELTGISMDGLKSHIEGKFELGMCWENHSPNGWHIDHIRPCASFDLTDPKQQKECFHYTNLQPLWAEDNLRKSDKWEDEVV